MSTTEKFEHYEVLKREDGSLFELGRGAMGITYKALDTDLECFVALKIINPSTIANTDAEQRFFREARSAAQLRHPNIASVFRLGKTGDGTHYYAMEFCAGQTLQQLVEQSGPIECRRALQFTLQVAKALIVAEERHLVHRDLKPSNLIVTQRSDEGEVIKVIDFGLAKTTNPEGTLWSSMGTHGFIGTAHFASPEQIEDKPVDTRSDIYSLGSTLWFMLLGKPPFDGSLARIMSQHLTAPPDFSRLRGLPEKVIALLRRMMEKSAEDRPQSALGLRREIIDCLETTAAKDENEAPKEPATVAESPLPEFIAAEPPKCEPLSKEAWTPSLVELLKVRSVLSPADAFCIGEVLAAELDRDQGVSHGALRIRDITIHFQDSPNAEQARARLHEPPAAWPAFNLVIEPGDTAVASEAVDPSLMTTIIPGENAIGDNAQQLARLLYELLGGVAGSRYVPVARLGEAGNAVLQRATIVGLAGYPKLGDLIEKLREASALAAAPPPVSPSISTPEEPRGKSSSGPPPLPPQLSREATPSSKKSGKPFHAGIALRVLAGVAGLIMLFSGIKTIYSGFSKNHGATRSEVHPPPQASAPIQFTIYDDLGAGQISESVQVYVDEQTEPASTINLTPQQAHGAAVVNLAVAGHHAFSVKTESVVIDLNKGSKKIISSGRWENDFRGGEKYDLSATPQDNVDSYQLQVTLRN